MESMKREGRERIREVSEISLCKKERERKRETKRQRKVANRVPLGRKDPEKEISFFLPQSEGSQSLLSGPKLKTLTY